MGMMKEHVRGPIKCCDTLAEDILRITRAEALVYHEHYHAVELDSICRGRKDNLGGNCGTRVHGAPCLHTDPLILRQMLGVIIDKNLSIDDGSWQPDDNNHEDLVIQEYTKASVGGTSHSFCVDWSSGQNTTANYYLMYTQQREGRSPSTREIGKPDIPSMEQLQSTESPPPDYIQEMSYYFYHHYVGKLMHFQLVIHFPLLD